MKILMIASGYLPNLGGLQVVAASIAAGMQRRGHTVRVIAARTPRSLPARERLDGVAIERWTFLAPRFTHLHNRRPELWLAGLVQLPLTVARLLWYIAHARPDVVNLQFAGSPALCVLLAHRLRRFPLVVSLHGADVQTPPPHSARGRAIKVPLLRRANVITVCSRYLASHALNLAPEAGPHMRVIYNGVVPRDCDTGPDASPARDGVSSPEALSAPVRHTLFAAGRFDPKKGFDVLLRALAQCADPALCLNLAGNGAERDGLRALARELRLDSRVTFMGALSSAEVFGAMCRSSLVVMPSRQEPFGLVALEGMQAGRPIVASDVGGLPEVLAGAEGLLIPPGDPGALAAAIDKVLARLAAQPDFGSLNRSLAARFSLSAMLDGYEQACVDAIAESRNYSA